MKLEYAYVAGRTQLEMKAGMNFKLTFEPGTPWAAFGPLEGETTRQGSFLALLPKTLNGMSEDQITQQAFKLAQEQGQQVDLMAVRVLMKTIKLDIGADGKTLTVTDPPANDPDHHPLAGAKFGAAL